MRQVKTTLLIIAGVLIGAFAIVKANADDAEKVKIGDNVPAFEIKSQDAVITSEALKGKVVLVNFFATWCPPCVKELPHLQKDVWEKYKNNDDFVLLVVGREHTAEQLTKFAQTRKLNLPFYPDPDRDVYSLFAANTIPRNYIIDKSGKIIYASTGFSEKEFETLKSTLAKQLK